MGKSAKGCPDLMDQQCATSVKLQAHSVSATAMRNCQRAKLQTAKEPDPAISCKDTEYRIRRTTSTGLPNFNTESKKAAVAFLRIAIPVGLRISGVLSVAEYDVRYRDSGSFVTAVPVRVRF